MLRAINHPPNVQPRHLVFVSYQSRPTVSTSVPSTSTATHTSEIHAPGTRPRGTIEEDPIDKYWLTKDGKVPRGHTRPCEHSLNGMCDYCLPLEPHDASYYAEHSIKHLSYHAHLRKLSPKNTASSFVPPLNPLNHKVKVSCPTASHPGWPAGICTACQPSAITLQSQPFRMVDHLEIASTDLIDRFLQAGGKRVSSGSVG